MCPSVIGTADLSLAIQKAEMARRTPLLEDSGRWATEAKLYVAERIHQGRLSRMYGRVRQYALISESKRMNWVRPNQLTTDGLQRWYEALRRDQSENTAINYLAHIRGFCAWLLENGKVRENSALLVKRARSRAVPRKNFCSKETVRKLLSSCVDPELKFVLHCGFHCGLRKGEIVNAQPHGLWYLRTEKVKRRAVGSTSTSDPRGHFVRVTLAGNPRRAKSARCR